MRNLLFRRDCQKAAMVFLLLLSYSVKGQEITEEHFTSDRDYLNPGLVEKSDINVLKTPEIKKVSFSFSTGMVLMTAGQRNNVATTYVAQAIAYNVSPRLRFRAGSLIFMNNFYQSSESSSLQEPLLKSYANRIALFFAADYFINERITVTGTYYKIPGDKFFQPGTPSDSYLRYPAVYPNPSESMSLGLNYKIIKGFSVGAEFRISNPYQSYLSPFPYEFAFPSFDQIYW
jgi:hypothetical protein